MHPSVRTEGDAALAATYAVWGKAKLAQLRQVLGPGPWGRIFAPAPGVSVRVSVDALDHGTVDVRAIGFIEGLVLSVPHRMGATDPETGRPLKFMRYCALERNDSGAPIGYKPEKGAPAFVPAKYGYTPPRLGVWPDADAAPTFWDFYAGDPHAGWTEEEWAYWTDLTNVWNEDLGGEWATKEHFEFRKRYRQYIFGKEHYHVSYSFMGYSIDPGGPLPVAETFMDEAVDVTFGLSIPFSMHGRIRYYEFPKRLLRDGPTDFLSNGVYVNGKLYSFPGGYQVLAARVVSETVGGVTRRVLAMVGWAGVISGSTTVYLYRVPLKKGWPGWKPVIPTDAQRFAVTVPAMARTGFNIGDTTVNSSALAFTDEDRWSTVSADWDLDTFAWDLPAEWRPWPYSPWDISEDGWSAAGMVSSYGNTSFFETLFQPGGPATGFGTLATWTVVCDFSAGSSTVTPGWDTGYTLEEAATSFDTVQKVATYYDGGTLKWWEVAFSGSNVGMAGIGTIGSGIYVGIHPLCAPGLLYGGASGSYSIRLLKGGVEYCVLRQSAGGNTMSQVLPLRIGCPDGVDIFVTQSFSGGAYDGSSGAVTNPSAWTNTLKVTRDGTEILSEDIPLRTNLEWLDHQLAVGVISSGEYAALIAAPGFEPAGVTYVPPGALSLGVPAYSPAEIWVARDKRIASEPTLVSLGLTMFQAQRPDYRRTIWATPKIHRIVAHGLVPSTLVPSAVEAQDDTLYPLGLV